LKGEILVLVCLLAICAVKSEFIDIDMVKAVVLRQVVKIDRNNLDTYRFLAGYYDGIIEQPKKAAEAYEGIVRLAPTDDEACVELGDAYWKCGQHEAALDAYIRAVTINPEWTWPHLVLAFSYRDLQRYEEAIEATHRVIAIHPGIAGLYVIHGELQEEAGHLSEGLAAYKHAVALKPDNAPARLHLAKAYLQRGDRELALKEYEVLKTLDQDLANELLPLISRADQK
jgi:tetratricopeptide (TPR) repeat protein